MTKKQIFKIIAITTIIVSLIVYYTITKFTNDNVKANASYTIGYSIGSNIFKDENLHVNNNKVLTGFQDALYKKNPVLAKTEIDDNINNLHKQILEKINIEEINNFLKVKDIIYNSNLTPKTNVDNPSTVIYKFFDYQCSYCSKLFLKINKAIADYTNTQIVFVEFPIFNEKNNASKYAAELGTAIYKLNGSQDYIKYHNLIFNVFDNEGYLTIKNIEKIAQKYSTINKMKEIIKNNKIDEHLKSNLKIGYTDIGIQGSPYIVIAPMKNPNTSNTTIIAGYSDQVDIKAAILKSHN